jgi:GDPmannose 4,6-dehydratase
LRVGLLRTGSVSSVAIETDNIALEIDLLDLLLASLDHIKNRLYVETSGSPIQQGVDNLLTAMTDLLEGKFADSRVLVTGCSGFVGPHLITRLLEMGADVYGIDRRKARTGDLLKRLGEYPQERVHIISADMIDISSIANALGKSEPNYIFHLAAQSFVPESFINPLSTVTMNTVGTANLLEAVRMKALDPRVVFAGSSEEYGLVAFSEKQWASILERHGSVFPSPETIPEVPIRETNPLRPMSPYAVSKVAGEYLMRDYCHTYGIKSVVSRAFNHEGAGRGDNFVTSVVTRQAVQTAYKEIKSMYIGDVTSFRDWSHVSDIVDGYLLLVSRGLPGEVYNQGSQRTNSVLSYILLSLEAIGLKPLSMRTLDGKVTVDNPGQLESARCFGLDMLLTQADKMLLDEELTLTIENRGLSIKTTRGNVEVLFDKDRYRPSEVPILLSETSKIRGIGFEIAHSLKDIIADQINYYLDRDRRFAGQQPA